MKNPSPGQFIPLGFNPHGDWGAYTIYTSRSRKVVRFPRAPPTKPPTYLQRRQRFAWRAAAAMWRDANNTTREWWRTLARINHLTITGHNAFIAYYTQQDKRWLASLKQPST
jgi:hypothetical protein